MARMTSSRALYGNLLLHEEYYARFGVCFASRINPHLPKNSLQISLEIESYASISCFFVSLRVQKTSHLVNHVILK